MRKMAGRVLMPGFPLGRGLRLLTKILGCSLLRKSVKKDPHPHVPPQSEACLKHETNTTPPVWSGGRFYLIYLGRLRDMI